MEAVAPSHKRWTRAEYERLIDDGYFAPTEQVELINGEILAMTPQKSRHSAVVTMIQEGLRAAFLPVAHTRAQLPLALDPDSEPEPDIAVVPGTPRDYLDAQPTAAWLVVEVADTSLAFDRRTKGPLYARAGIPDYWIANLVDNVLEVYREPIETATGWTYRLVQSHRPGDQIAPVMAASVPLNVADLLP
ncbi:MAG: Uma2 family endonuclease [Candidatus Sericytochromatia bacterium]|nr:Uma2 family endonuclease [Candidatus Sericytochromatia bacterium]